MTTTYTDRQIDVATITQADPVKHTAWFDNPPPDDLPATYGPLTPLLPGPQIDGEA